MPVPIQTLEIDTIQMIDHEIHPTTGTGIIQITGAVQTKGIEDIQKSLAEENELFKEPSGAY